MNTQTTEPASDSSTGANAGTATALATAATADTTTLATTEPSDDKADNNKTSDNGASDNGAGDDAASTIPFPTDTAPAAQDHSPDASLTVSDIRVGHHDGFDRVTFDIGGTGTPGWQVEYVTSPEQDGSGFPVDIAGDAYLQVMITGSGMPFETGVQEFSDRGPVTGPGLAAITEVKFLAIFEGRTQAIVGVTGTARPFRVFALTNPARVVVDVQS
jgi:hypothetical protein